MLGRRNICPIGPANQRAYYVLDWRIYVNGDASMELWSLNLWSVNNTRCPLLYVISLWKFLVTLWKGSVYQKVSLTQDSQSESLSHLILYKYSFQVDGRRIFCQSQPFPCSYERLFFVLCQYSLVLADITVDTVVSTELQWENLSHFISQTRLEDSKAKFQTSIFLDVKHEQERNRSELTAKIERRSFKNGGI